MYCTTYCTEAWCAYTIRVPVGCGWDDRKYRAIEYVCTWYLVSKRRIEHLSKYSTLVLSIHCRSTVQNGSASVSENENGRRSRHSVNQNFHWRERTTGTGTSSSIVVREENKCVHWSFTVDYFRSQNSVMVGKNKTSRRNEKKLPMRRMSGRRYFLNAK